ncbi:hypothetical protein MASR1M12_09820 [Erysipelotrichia bacterium]
MTNIIDSHNEAMNLAEQGFIQLKLGDPQTAHELFVKAISLEKTAVESMPPTIDSEPTRSILYRSAASLAYNIQDYEMSERFICMGLGGFPPEEIREELKNLFEDINFLRHLKAKGLVLEENHWLMSMAGDAVSFGGTAAEIFLTRVDRISNLFYRTVERLCKIPYRVAGGVSQEIKKLYGLYIRALAPASFSVTFQVGVPDPQLILPGFEEELKLPPQKVVTELFDCFDLFEKDDTEGLKSRIRDTEYFENFVGIAKQIAPDGQKINLVGFSTIQNGIERPVALRRSRKIQMKKKELEFSKNDQVEESNSFSLVGILRHAHSPTRGKFGLVKLLETDSGNDISIKVPLTIMKDVVQPYYEEKVLVQGTKIQGKHVLEEICSASE